MSKKIDILVAGVGGQGTLLASDILAEIGMRAGYDAKKSDVLGLSVRGGSVLSHVRWGADVASPVVRMGDMDLMLAFEPLEALRGIEWMRTDGAILCNTQPVPPISVSSGDKSYPDRHTIESTLRSGVASVALLNATALAVEIGTPKVANVVLLGAFSSMFEIALSIWEEVVLARVPDRFVKLNRAAFRRGREAFQKEAV